MLLAVAALVILGVGCATTKDYGAGKCTELLSSYSQPSMGRALEYTRQILHRDAAELQVAIGIVGTTSELGDQGDTRLAEHSGEG